MLQILIILPLISIIINNIKTQASQIEKVWSKREKTMLISIIEMYIWMYILLTYNQNIIDNQYRELWTYLYKMNIGIESLNITLITLTIILIPLLLLYKIEKNTTNISSVISTQCVHISSYLNIIKIIELLILIMFLSQDIFIFYIMYELLIIPMFLLIINYGSLRKKIEASYKFLIFTILGSIFFLFGLIYIYIHYSTFNIDLLHYFLSLENIKIQKLLWFSMILSLL